MRYTIKKHIINLLLAVWLLILHPISGDHLSAEGSATSPFPQTHLNSCQRLAASPSSLHYRINWQSLPAGTVDITIKDDAKEGTNASDGSQASVIRYDMVAKSLPVIDPIYPARIAAISEVNKASLLPIRYTKDSQEGFSKRRYADLHFDHKTNSVVSYAKDRPPRSIAITQDTLDPLCAIFITRTKLCAASDKRKITVSITDGKKVSVVEVKQIGAETIETEGGRFKTKVYSLEMDSISGLFSKKSGAKIYLWLSEDNFMPVRIKSEAVVGAFIATLVSVGA